MIKNVIFDLGNVLISFKPPEYFEKKNYPRAIRETILSDVFGSEEWQMLDSGKLTVTEAIDAIARKSSLKRNEIAHIFNLRTDIMFPLDPNIKVLPELRKRGLKLYYLSNFPGDIFDEVRSGYYFFKYFEGGLISAEAKYNKPESGIYKMLLEKYSLDPGECLYIDDLEKNVRVAETFGMKGIHVNGSDVLTDQIKAALKDRFNNL